MRHKTILAQGGTVHYWIIRNENVSDCIVFTHGATADHTMFEKQIPYFSGNYTIILWDVPMHGLSRPYQQFSYRDTAEILHSILQKENIEKTFIVGMSMGGYPSQHFANGDNPYQVNKEIENFITETVRRERKNYAAL